MRSLTISKNQLPLNMAFLYMIILGILDSIANVFIPNNVRSILCLWCLVAIFFAGKWKLFRVLPCDIVFILMIGVYCFNNYYIKTFNSFGFLRNFIFFLLLFVGRNIYEFPSRVLKIYGRLSLIHVFATIWLHFDGWSYRNIVVKMFDSERQQLLLDHYNHGWIPGLANHYSSNGMYLATAIILLASLWLCTSSYRVRKRAGMLLLLASVAMLFTGKRAHAIFSIASILVMYYVYAINRKHGRMFKILGLACAIIAVLYIGYALFPDLFSFIGRFEETASTGDVTQGRFATWDVVIRVFLSNPIFGIGWLGFSQIAEKYGVTINAHNVYLQLLCETGIVGFTVFLAVFILMLAVSFNLFAKMRKNTIVSNEVEQRNMMFSIGMQIFFLLYCFTGNPLYDAPMFVPYFLSLVITTYYWSAHRMKND